MAPIEEEDRESSGQVRGATAAYRGEGRSLMDRLSLAITLVAVVGVAAFLGYLLGEYAISMVTQPATRRASTTVNGTSGLAGEVGALLNGAGASGVTGSASGSSGASSAPATAPGSSGAPAGSTSPAPGGALTGPASTAANSTGTAGTTGTGPVGSAQPSAAGVVADRYRIQVGAFSREANARSLVERLGNDGFRATVVASGGQYKVQIIGYATRQEAERDLERVRSRYDPQAWITTP